MRKGHNPNYEQKKALTRNKLDWTEWLVVKTLPNSVVFKNKKTDEVIELEIVSKDRCH